MSKQKQPDWLPMSVAIKHPKLFEDLQIAYAYYLFCRVANWCDSKRSKRQPCSVTLRQLVDDMGGLKDYTVVLFLSLIARGDDPLVAITRDSRVSSVSLTSAGYRVIREIQDSAEEQSEAFRAVVQDRWSQVNASTKRRYGSADEMVAGVVREIRHVVSNDVANAIAWVRRLTTQTRRQSSNKIELQVAQAPALSACVELQEHLNEKVNAPATEDGHRESASKEAEAISTYLANRAQWEIVNYLVENRYPELSDSIRGASSSSSPRCIVMDLSVVVALISRCDRLNVAARDSLSLAEELAQTGALTFDCRFSIPAGYYYYLSEQLEYCRRDFSRIKAMWHPGLEKRLPREDPLCPYLTRLAKFSLFRDFAYFYNGRSFEAFARSKLAEYRRLTWEHGEIGRDVQPRGKTREDYTKEIIQRVQNEMPGYSGVLWTFNENLARLPFGVYGGVMDTYLEPDMLAKVDRSQELLRGLRTMPLWKSGIFGLSHPRYERTVTRDLLRKVHEKFV